jgi:hypothetical protein
MSDIPFDAIDKTKVDEGVLHDVKNVCLTELGSVPATRMFMRDFAADMDFQRFLAVWSFEEAKHSLALEKWLNANGLELESAEMNRMNLEFAPAPWIETLTMHFLGEQRLGMWYASFSGIGPGVGEKRLEEPVLRQVFTLMAEDEWRHAGCYFAFLKKAVAEKPEYMQNIGKMTLWMLRGRHRHPTNITEPSIMGQLEDPTFCVNMLERFLTPESEKVMEKRVLNCYSILAGETIDTQKDVIKYMRNKFGSKTMQEVAS